MYTICYTNSHHLLVSRHNVNEISFGLVELNVKASQFHDGIYFVYIIVIFDKEKQVGYSFRKHRNSFFVFFFLVFWNAKFCCRVLFSVALCLRATVFIRALNCHKGCNQNRCLLSISLSSLCLCLYLARLLLQRWGSAGRLHSKISACALCFQGWLGA